MCMNKTMLYDTYFDQVCSVLNHVRNTQGAAIEKVAALVADCWAKDGIFYIFGCGHSHIIGEDLFYRAGGSAGICAMLDGDLMLHEGAVKSSHYEKMQGLAKPIFERYGLTNKDVLLVASTSGINSVPVEMAMCAKAEGISVVAITSASYFEDESRHPSGKKLCDVADIVLDNGVSHGDASVTIGDSQIRVGPISTISSCMLAQAIVVQASENLWQRNITPPIFVSGNIPGGMDRNKSLIERYMPRIKHL